MNDDVPVKKETNTKTRLASWVQCGLKYYVTPLGCGKSVYNSICLSYSSFLSSSPLVICSAGPSIGCAGFALCLRRAERKAFDEATGEASRLFTADGGAGGCGGVVVQV